MPVAQGWDVVVNAISNSKLGKDVASGLLDMGLNMFGQQQAVLHHLEKEGIILTEAEIEQLAQTLRDAEQKYNDLIEERVKDPQYMEKNDLSGFNTAGSIYRSKANENRRIGKYNHAQDEAYNKASDELSARRAAAGRDVASANAALQKAQTARAAVESRPGSALISGGIS